MNKYCQIDPASNFNISELINIYNELFVKQEKFSQGDFYSGVGFQGRDARDTKSAPIDGPLLGSAPHMRLPPRSEYPAAEKYIEEICQRHKTLCVGEYANILDYLEMHGWFTFRARVMTLLPNNPVNWHVDGYDTSMRYHVPIITNDQFYLQWRDIEGVHSCHIPANGKGYFIRTDVPHQYINRGTEPRTHIIIDIRKHEYITN
jgi:hypothetical protein